MISPEHWQYMLIMREEHKFEDTYIAEDGAVSKVVKCITDHILRDNQGHQAISYYIEADMARTSGLPLFDEFNNIDELPSDLNLIASQTGFLIYDKDYGEHGYRIIRADDGMDLYSFIKLYDDQEPFVVTIGTSEIAYWFHA
jgi:hypothetical protein